MGSNQWLAPPEFTQVLSKCHVTRGGEFFWSASIFGRDIMSNGDGTPRNYTVTLEVREIRILAMELIDVQAANEEKAVEIAHSQYEKTGRSEFDVELEDIESDEIIYAHAEEAE
jgi:hypothetical protein